MDIGKSISFVFQDKKWIEKVLIGGLVLLIPFVGIALVLGYMVDLLRNTRQGKEYPLPEWDEWGEKIIKGFKLLLLYIIWSLPILIVVFPSIFLGLVAADSNAEWIFGLIVPCVGCLVFLYLLLLIVANPGITIKFAEREEFTDGLDFQGIFAFSRDNISDIIITMLVIVVLGFLLNLVGTIFCFIGVLFTSFWIYAVQGNLYGQIGLESSSTEVEG